MVAKPGEPKLLVVIMKLFTMKYTNQMYERTKKKKFENNSLNFVNGLCMGSIHV